MDYIYELKDKLCTELEEIAKKQEMGAGDLELIHKLSDTIKNLDKIEMLESGHSNDYSRDYNRDYDRDSSYRRHRDSRGRYARNYSRHDATSDMVEMMESMMDSVSGKDREVLRRCMEQLGR